jgi:HPt (histidine-containing phosphotransfer) domain-containing protein
MHSPYTFDARLELLDSMASGNLSFKQELIDIYLRDLTKMKRELSQAFSERDFVSLKRVFHTLKSNAKVLGSESLSALCFLLEKASAGQDLKRVAGLLPEFSRQVEMHDRDLRESMKSLS